MKTNKPKSIARSSRVMPLLLVCFLSTVTLAAILSRYTGLIEMSIRLDGAQVRIDGRQSRTFSFP